MPIKQIVKTNKRIVYVADAPSSTTFTVGLTASAFYNMTNSEQVEQSKVSGITAGSACISKVVTTGQCTIEQSGEVIFRHPVSASADLNFERFTLRSMTAGATAAITVNNATAVVEFVIGQSNATQSQLG
jgi:hypothetical protein